MSQVSDAGGEHGAARRTAPARWMRWRWPGASLLLAAGVLCSAGAMAAGAAAGAQSGVNSALIGRGRTAFFAHCDACHGREHVTSHGGMEPATASLAIKYRGTKIPPQLQNRTDLTPSYVKYIVRHGDHLMPFFRKTMVSDAELDAIAAYLARNNPALHPKTSSAPRTP